jgi:hypothetical protein
LNQLEARRVEAAAAQPAASELTSRPFVL